MLPGMDGPSTHAIRAALMLALLLGAVGTAGCSLLGSDPARGAGEPAKASAAEARAETDATLAIVERMSRHLESLAAFRVSAEVRYDAVQRSGQRIEFGSERQVAIRRPDRLRVEVRDWDGPREWLVYDGSRLSAAAPSANVYATTEQSGSFEEAVARFEKEGAGAQPLAELFEAGLDERLRALVDSGARVGTVQIDGRLCDHLAFRGASVDFQLFVERSESPLPRRLVIDYREEPGRPQFRASLRAWETNAELSDAFFRFAPPIGAQRVSFDELIALLRGAERAPQPTGDAS